MDVLLFCFALLALTAFVARPLYERRRTQTSDPDAGEAQARHRAIVRALSDLEVDRASELVSTDVYEAEKSALEAQGAEALRRLDGRSD